MNKTILITGANAGIGKEVARQLALKSETEKIYLACRNEDKALDAKKYLEEVTGKNIFEIILLDVANVDSVKSAVNKIESINALVMNAGGMGGKDPGGITSEGVTNIFAANVLGHAILLEGLLNANKLKNAALFVGTEAARGIPKMGFKRPALNSYSPEEFLSLTNGSYWGDKFEPMQAYGHVKYMATLWMSALARRYKDIRFVTMSPGGTGGTNVMEDLPPVSKFLFKYVGTKLMPLMGMMHRLEVGSKRIVDGITDNSYESGVFYASKEKVLTGPVVDQSILFGDLTNETHQESAYEAMQRLIQRESALV